MSWYKKALIVNFKEIFSSAIPYLVTVLLLGLWYFYSGKTFEWVWIEPLELPPYQRLFYGALVFVGPGRLLFKSGFYLALRELLNFRDFKEVKAIIWAFLLWLMYFKLAPFAVDVLNWIISIGYNLYNLVLYVAPWFGVSIILFSFYLYFRKQHAII